MKTLKLLFSFSILFLVFSCSNDDSGKVSPTEDGLVGTWDLTDFALEGTGTLSGIPVGIPVTATGKNMNAVVNLTKDPNNITSSGNLTVAATIKVPGADEVNQDLPINLNTIVGSGTWSLNSNGQLVISENGEEQKLDIIEYTENSIKAQTKIDFPVPYNNLNIMVNATVDITLNKQ